MKLEYLGTDITELSIKKNIEDDMDIELETNTNFTVYFSEDGSSCIGEFQVEISSMFDPDQLSITYSSKSFFNIHDARFDIHVDEEVHMEVFDRIFPMCSETIKHFAAMAGVPNIALPEMNAADMEMVSSSKPHFTM